MEFKSDEQIKLVDYSVLEGQAALFYKTPPFDGGWTAVSDIQGVNLGLTPGSGNANDPALWDGIFLHSQGGTAFFDNILLRKPDGSALTPQFIDFAEIEKQLTTAAAFDLMATADSGLPVEFEIVSGPATLNGNTLTLDGPEGFMEVRASQPGDGSVWAAASPVTRTFEVIDPSLYAPELLVRNPVDQREVFMPELSAFMMVASVSIEHDDVLDIDDVTFNIDGQDLAGKNWNTGYYTTWWTPPTYGSYTLTVTSKSSENVVTTETAVFEVTQLVEPLVWTILDSKQAGVADTNIVFPSYIGSFDNVRIFLEYDCPPEGCEPWDRINQQQVQGPTGEWFGFMRYITPYGVACSDEQDITDYMSLFQGMVRLQLPYEWRSVITLKMEYSLGTPAYKYSWVDEIWDPEFGSYPFGDMANPQPVPVRNIDLMPNVESARLKIINSGHGWGDNNSGNAAEFYEATHRINVNGNTEYTQHLWEDCNPNPASCSPQNGTWFFDRAGWCPGALVPVWDFDLTDYVSSPFELQYQFDPGYTDFCHPNNPNCISGQTCSDCSASSNPILVVDAHLVSYSNAPLDGALTEVKEQQADFGLSVSPNPNNGQFYLFTEKNIAGADLEIVNAVGQVVYKNKWNSMLNNEQSLDISYLSKGLYWILLKTDRGFDRAKVMVHWRSGRLGERNLFRYLNLAE